MVQNKEQAHFITTLKNWTFVELDYVRTLTYNYPGVYPDQQAPQCAHT